MSSNNKEQQQNSRNNYRNKRRQSDAIPKNNAPVKQFFNGETLQGKLQVTKSGMGFVIPLAEGVADVMIRPRDFCMALNGDTVEAIVNKESTLTGKREGKITKVIHRKQNEFVGTIELSKNFAFFIADGDKNVPDVYIPFDKINGATDGNKVVVRLIKWNSKEKKPLGEVVSILKAEDINDAAMKSLMLENGFEIEYPKEVLEETAALSAELDKAEIKKRKDFRKTLTFTIDPTDSKDFDDAISFKRTRGKDLYEVGVHIADVSHYVRPGSALDKNAYERSTSVYLPDRVNPMLPEKISNELCSLRPNEDKFTFSAVFTINLQGEIKNTWIGRTAIHSDRRFTYDQVQEILEGKEDPLADEILKVNQISKALRLQRFEKGAINFSSQEVRFILDEHNKPIGIKVNESNDSHHLIEELMLLANRSVAELAHNTKVEDQSIPFPYRIHDRPDKEKLLPFISFAKKFGYKFDVSSEESISTSFNSMLEKSAGKPEAHMLQQLGIRTMAKAAYSPSNIGHFGLGFVNYCHFTSPIRRYPDVMVHRIIQEILDGAKPVDEAMVAKCRHASEKERASLECERSANKYKQVEYMQQFVGETFEGLISGVSGFGFWVETLTTKCEGLVSIKDLASIDEFKLVEEDYSLLGTRTGLKFRMGDVVNIRVAAANLEKKQIDYSWVPEEALMNKITEEKRQKKDALIKLFGLNEQPKIDEIPTIPVQILPKEEKVVAPAENTRSNKNHPTANSNKQSKATVTNNATEEKTVETPANKPAVVVNNEPKNNSKSKVPNKNNSNQTAAQQANLPTETNKNKEKPTVVETVKMPATEKEQTAPVPVKQQNVSQQGVRNNKNKQNPTPQRPATNTQQNQPVAKEVAVVKQEKPVTQTAPEKTVKEVVLSADLLKKVVAQILQDDALLDKIAELALAKKAKKKKEKKDKKKKKDK